MPFCPPFLIIQAVQISEYKVLIYKGGVSCNARGSVLAPCTNPGRPHGASLGQWGYQGVQYGVHCTLLWTVKFKVIRYKRIQCRTQGTALYVSFKADVDIRPYNGAQRFKCIWLVCNLCIACHLLSQYELFVQSMAPCGKKKTFATTRQYKICSPSPL